MRCFGDIRLLKLPCPWNPGQGSLKVIVSDTIRQLAYGFLLQSYSNFVPKMQCTVFEVWRHIGRKSPKNLTHSHLARSLQTSLLLHKPCKRFASVARVCQRQLAFLVKGTYGFTGPSLLGPGRKLRPAWLTWLNLALTYGPHKFSVKFHRLCTYRCYPNPNAAIMIFPLSTAY